MLHLIGGIGSHPGNAVLRTMFAARKRVFVDLLGWDIPVLAGRYEIDRFDTPDAIYIVVTDRAGAHRASARLLPTDRPHILDSMFACLCERPVPRGPRIFEITRFCLERGLVARERRAARNELVSALARFGVHAGITHYTGVAEPGWIEQILTFGWHARMLGPPREVAGLRLGAIEIEIDATTPMLLARAGIQGGLTFAGEVSDAA